MIKLLFKFQEKRKRVHCNDAERRGRVKQNHVLFYEGEAFPPKKNVMGLMPHPERCCEKVLGYADGMPFFESLKSILN